MSSLLIVLGLALCTGSFFVTTLAATSSAVWWIIQSPQFPMTTETLYSTESRNFFDPRIQEILLAAGILIAVGVIYQLRGLIPLV